MNTFKFKIKNQQVNRSSEVTMNKLTRSRIILPVLVLLTCLVISYISWDISDTNRKNELRSYFEFRARDVNDRIKHRISEYETILRGTRGLFNASENVNRAEFRDFLNSLSLEKNYPGIQGVGFSLIVPSEQLKKHITTIHNEGFTEYKIWPEGNRETYTSIIYLEPFSDLNLRAFGYDMYSEPVRQKAMATSRDSNKTIISTKVNLVQETGKEVQAGFLMYLPVYRYGTQNTTLTERRTNIVGWVYSPFRMGDFMKGILGERAADLAIEIYDGKNILNETKMYSSIAHPTDFHQPLGIKKVIEFNNHEWTVLIKYTPELESRIGSNTAGMILIVGISLSILLGIITWLLVNKRMRKIIADTERKLVENSLKKLQEEQQILLDNIPAWVFFKDTGNRFIRVNKTFADVMGMSIEQLEGKSLFDIFPKEQAEAFWSDDKEVLSSGKPKVNIIETMESSKGTIWVQTDKIPFRDIQGKIVGVIGLTLDITERKRAEEALQNERLLLRTLIDNIPDSIYSKDLACRKTLVNLTELRFMGVKSEAEVLGKDDFDFYPKELAEGFFADDQSVIQSGEPVLNKEEYVTGENGQQRWLLTSKIPLKDENGNITGIVGIGRDITERKHAEEEIQKGNEQFKMVWNGSIDGMRIMDENGMIILVNDAFCNMVGLVRDQLEGAHLSVLFHKSINEISDPNEQNSKMEIYKLRFLENKIEPKFERELYLWDGRKVWFEVTNAYMENAGGKSVLLSIFRDITERKQAESVIQQQNNRLQELNASKDKFFSIIAHDLKSPLNGFLNLTALMSDTTEKISLDEFAEYSKMLNKAARNINMLLNNLLEWAQIQKGIIQFTPTDFDLSKLVSRSIDTISQRALQKQIQIINEIHNSQKVYADEKMIDTIIRNLLSNAVKFSGTGGKVIINTKHFDDGTIQVSIEDNGVGISEDMVKKLFRIDQKVGSIGTDGEPSTGLGLLLCKEFVEKHNCKIWVESKENVGSTFYFTLQEKN